MSNFGECKGEEWGSSSAKSAYLRVISGIWWFVLKECKFCKVVYYEVTGVREKVIKVA